jgi:hypothetical protein
MFEIIMLFAFLYAAACQLFPERPTTTRASHHEKGQQDKEDAGLLQRPEQKDRTTSTKSKSRCHRYAHAA